MIELTETQLSLQHILGNAQDHQAWHSSFPDKERECPFCEMLTDLENYMKGAAMTNTQDDLLNFASDPDTIKQAVEGSMQKRQAMLANKREVQTATDAAVDQARLSDTSLQPFEIQNYKRLMALESRGIEEYRKLRASPTLSAEAVVSFINQLSAWNLATTGISVLEAYVKKQLTLPSDRSKTPDYGALNSPDFSIGGDIRAAYEELKKRFDQQGPPTPPPVEHKAKEPDHE